MRLVALLMVVAFGAAIGVALAARRYPTVQRVHRATSQRGPHAFAMTIAFARWRRLTAAAGLARWKTVHRRKGRTAQRPSRVPHTRHWRLTPVGFEFVVKHRNWQSIESYRSTIGVLQSGLRGRVRVLRVFDSAGYVRHDRSRIVVVRRDPFAQVPRPLALSTTRHRLGILEDGRDWIVCFETTPHLLVTGETGAGKSGTEMALLASLAPTDAIIVLVDLKFGVTAEPYRPRASVIAETAEQAAAVLKDLHRIGKARAALCRTHGVDKIYDLPPGVRPPEVFVVVDEVAELTYRAGDTKQASDAALEALLRAVQLLRFVGVHIVLCGQRFGSSLGRHVTTIRAQLPGRVCLRVADRETADMCVGDISPDAVRAALSIPQHVPGVAVVNGGPDGWQMARTSFTPVHQLAAIAAEHAPKRTEWVALMAECHIEKENNHDESDLCRRLGDTCLHVGSAITADGVPRGHLGAVPRND